MRRLVPYFALGLSLVVLSPQVQLSMPAMAASTPPPPDDLARSYGPVVMHAVKITQQEFGETWPFTVSEAILSCHGAGEVVLTVKGIIYAVNGVAKENNRYADLNQIWAPHPFQSEVRRDIAPILDRGLELCRAVRFHGTRRP